MVTTANSSSGFSTAANSFSESHLKAIFTGEMSNYLDEVEQLERTVGQDASVAEYQSTIQLYRQKARNVDSM